MRPTLTLLLLLSLSIPALAQTPTDSLYKGTLNDTTAIEAAVFTEKVKQIELKYDKLVYNVSQSSFASGSNALDLIKKAPGVVVDQDGNVKLNGKAVSVWIDGRPSHMDGKSLEALLRSTSGESIDKFELMEHPSAKFDASGQGGIINIKTKKNGIKGLNGNISLNGGAMGFKTPDMYGKKFLTVPWDENIYASLAYRTKKTNTFVNLYQYVNNTDILIDVNLKLLGTDFKQRSRSFERMGYSGGNVKIGHDWFIDPKNTVGVILYIPGGKAPVTSFFSNTEQAGMKMSSYVNDLSKNIQYSANANFTHIFDESRSAELTTNLDYYRQNARTDNRQSDTTIVQDAPAFIGEKNILARNQYDIYSAKVDYQTLLWKKVMFEAGGKWALSSTKNSTRESTLNVFENGEFFPSERLNEHSFDYNEHVAALYISAAGNFGSKVSLKAGLRGEFTSSKGSWKNAHRRNYFDLFPTVYVGYMPTEKWRLSAMYSRRIARPNYSQLDPTKVVVDARTYIIGNPDLLPEYADAVALGFSYGDHLYLQLSYSYSHNLKLQIPSSDLSGNQIFEWCNFGYQHMAFANIGVSSLPLCKWLYWTLNLSLGYAQAKSREYPDFDNGGFTAQGYTNFSFNLPKGWSMDLDANATAPMRYGVYDIKWMYKANFALRKSLLDGKLRLTLRCDDLLRSNGQSMKVLDPNGKMQNDIVQKFSNQKILLGVSWTFGKAENGKQRKVGNLEELSRVGQAK